MSEVLEDELDDFYFVHFFPNVVFEAVHAFLGRRWLTIMSRSALSVFLFLSLSGLAASMFK